MTRRTVILRLSPPRRSPLFLYARPASQLFERKYTDELFSNHVIVISMYTYDISYSSPPSIQLACVGTAALAVPTIAAAGTAGVGSAILTHAGTVGTAVTSVGPVITGAGAGLVAVSDTLVAGFGTVYGAAQGFLSAHAATAAKICTYSLFIPYPSSTQPLPPLPPSSIQSSFILAIRSNLTLFVL
jgi:hypothetical protein